MDFSKIKHIRFLKARVQLYYTILSMVYLDHTSLYFTTMYIIYYTLLHCIYFSILYMLHIFHSFFPYLHTFSISFHFCIIAWSENVVYWMVVFFSWMIQSIHRINQITAGAIHWFNFGFFKKSLKRSNIHVLCIGVYLTIYSTYWVVWIIEFHS